MNDAVLRYVILSSANPYLPCVRGRKWLETYMNGLFHAPSPVSKAPVMKFDKVHSYDQ